MHMVPVKNDIRKNNFHIKTELKSRLDSQQQSNNTTENPCNRKPREQFKPTRQLPRDLPGFYQKYQELQDSSNAQQDTFRYFVTSYELERAFTYKNNIHSLKCSPVGSNRVHLILVLRFQLDHFLTDFTPSVAQWLV